MLSKYRNQDIGLLILRLGLAYVFLTEAYAKFIHIAMTAKFFGSIGLPYPPEFVYFIAIVELFGGLCMLLGVFTDIAGLLLACDMLGVIATVRKGPMAHGILAGHNYEFMLMLMALSIVLIGAGRFSVMRQKQKQILV